MAARTYKTLVVGPRGVGKTSLVKRYLYDSFDESYTASVGVDMSVYNLQFPDGNIVVTVLDLAGHQTFAALKNRFYWDAQHVIAVFDVNNASSFKVIPKWYNSLSQGLCVPGGMALSGSLVANKADLADKPNDIRDDALLLARLLDWDYMETSAKTGHRVAELFVHAAIACRMQQSQGTHIHSMDITT